MATFSWQGGQHVGFGLTLNETPWAIFSTGSGGTLYARTNNGSTSTDTPLAGSWLALSAPVPDHVVAGQRRLLD